MAQEAETERGGSSIARAPKRTLGYDTGQVDAFLNRAHALYESEEPALTQTDIQNVSFDLAKGGYDITQVDAALARLERAVVDKQTAAQIARQGRVAWRAQTEQLYRRIEEHASRAQGERFRAGTRKQPSYDRRQVDRLIDDIMNKAASELAVDGTDPKPAADQAGVSAASVSNALFTQRTGARGYDERQVDYYLNACVQLLSRLESFERVADLVGQDSDSSGETTPSPARSASDSVPPLFQAAAPQPGPDATAVPSSVSGGASAHESFDALHKAEQAIFTPAAIQPRTVAATAGAMNQGEPAVADAGSHAAEQAVETVSPVVTSQTASSDDASRNADASTSSTSSSPSTVTDDFLRKADPSLAELAHLAETTQEKADAPSVFHPHMPSLTTPSVPETVPDTVSSAAPSEPPASDAVVEVSDAPSPSQEMPPSFAPEQPVVKHHDHVIRTGSAEPGVARTAASHPVQPDPQAARSGIGNGLPGAGAAASMVPTAPANASAHASTPEPLTSDTSASSPTAGVNGPQAATQVVRPKGADDTVFPSIFPQVDTDIPDLSFPSLYGDDK